MAGDYVSQTACEAAEVSTAEQAITSAEPPFRTIPMSVITPVKPPISSIDSWVVVAAKKGVRHHVIDLALHHDLKVGIAAK